MGNTRNVLCKLRKGGYPLSGGVTGDRILIQGKDSPFPDLENRRKNGATFYIKEKDPGKDCYAKKPQHQRKTPLRLTERGFSKGTTRRPRPET